MFCVWLPPTEHRGFRVHPHAGRCECFAPFYGRVTLHSWMDPTVLTHPPVDGHLRGFRLVALVRSAMNVGEHICV